ncbi:MAG: hypothetical protein ACLFVJ_15830 [Persicimonas sp.]
MQSNLPHWIRPWRRSIALTLAITMLGLGLFVSSASATVMKHADLERLIEISDFIVHGRIVEQDTYFDEEQDRVVTDTTISIERDFTGQLDDKVTIQQWGGEHDGKFHSIPGDARFESDEEVIVFLHQGDDDVIALSALSQAKYSVETTDDGKLVSRDLSDITFYIEGPDGGNVKHVPGETRSYASFVAELEALVAGIKEVHNE